LDQSFRFSEELDFVSTLSENKIETLIKKILESLKKEKTVAKAIKGRFFKN